MARRKPVEAVEVAEIAAVETVAAKPKFIYRGQAPAVKLWGLLFRRGVAVDPSVADRELDVVYARLRREADFQEV